MNDLKGGTPAPQHQQAKSLWATLSADLTAALAVAGVVAYAITSFQDAQYYWALKIDPRDVGVDFPGTLARYSVLLALVLLLAILLSFLLYITIKHWPKQLAFRVPGKANFNRLLFGLLIIILLATGIVGSINALDAASWVKQGQVVSPLKVGPFLVGSFTAYPVIVDPIGESNASSVVRQLKSHLVFYIGQNNGTVVLYDSTAENPVYLPASTVSLTIQGRSV
jgi:hypothetical protein